MSLLSSFLPSAKCAEVASGSTQATREPVYRVSEKPEAYSLTVYLPGVSREALQVTAEDDVITVRGERRWQAPAGWQTIHRESNDEVFQLRLRHDDSIDAEKIQAELRNGVLSLTLPKAEAAKPRRISIN